MRQNQVTPTPAFGQVWKLGDRLALLVSDVVPNLDGPAHLVMTEIINQKPSVPHLSADLVDGALVTRRGRWAFAADTPWLQCVDAAAAADAAAFLAGRDVDAIVVGARIITPMTPPSVIRFAESAVMQEWAHDRDAAAMIARL